MLKINLNHMYHIHMYINENSTETICLIDILFLEFLEINQRNIYLFKTFFTSFFSLYKSIFCCWIFWQ